MRNRSPEPAQRIDREAFKQAYAAHAGEQRPEEAAHRIVWSAVERGDVKIGMPG